MEIQIKNMVCPRCLYSVKSILSNLNIQYTEIELGKAKLINELSETQRIKLSDNLKVVGFELLNNTESQIISSIKAYLIEMIHYHKHQHHKTISVALAEYLNADYSTLSKIFSKTEKMTIEKYTINLKVERIKELLSYKEKTVSEIAFEMNYSSSAHLSNQFKKIKGLTPSQYKQQKNNSRKALDKI